MSQTDTAHAWWSRLRHQGLLLSPVVMIERYPNAPPNVPFYTKDRLRDAHTRFFATLGEDGDADQTAVLNFVDALLEKFVGHPAAQLAKQHSIPEKFAVPVRIGSKTETIRPHRVLYADESTGIAALLVMADSSPHVGRGRGRTKYAHLLELLRGTGHRLGLLTNGQQFRLIYAGLDFESWCEWESDRWFDDGEGTEELLGLRQLLSPESLEPIKEGISGLLDGVEESRKRQADLSSILRENVRQAVEYLLDEVSSANRTNAELLKLLVHHDGDRALTDAEAHEALMQATVRVVMRLVVCLFAESRQLLPINDPIYARSYGVRTLYELLDEATRCEGGTHVLFNRQTAWPRLMALFRLIHGGSSHGALPLRPYGGVLFRPGDKSSGDPVARALHILERSVTVADATIYYVLRKLLRGPLPVIKGKSKTFIEGPVDYTDLRTEFIGLIYEGLLDYRVKRTDEQIGPQVFLNLGREPVLPLSRLTDMLITDKKGLKDLLTTLRKERVTATAADEEEEAEEESGDVEADEEDSTEEITVETEDTEEVKRNGDYLDAVESAIGWAKEAVAVAGLVSKQGKKETDSEYQARIEAEATRLIKRVVATGEFYLVRAGNTRKGTGTFYTRPQLAVPTTHRTLEPLCYDKDDKGTLTPKTPEEILALKVCDPACGSASFLVAALHYLTDALYKSLCHHNKLDDPAQSKNLTLPFGRPRTNTETEQLLPFPPNDPQRGHSFEERVKALLRRHVVERCIYGVDVNPLAVEFARVSLWVETLDAELPFSFLDHKIKVGNSLVGCWLDRVEDYPLKAWEREGGDGKDGPRTQRIEALLKGEKIGKRRSGDGRIKQEMRQVIESKFSNQPPLFPDLTITTESVVAVARAEYDKLHDLPISDPDERERYYREHLENSSTLRTLLAAMDEWCAVWFWPADEESFKHVPTPLTFHKPSQRKDAVVERVTTDMKFFHWELEFPDLFTPDRRGLDAVIANPPWDIVKPNTKEFFSESDPLFRTLGKRAVPKRQRELIAKMPGLQDEWETHVSSIKAMSNWVGGNAEPFAVPLARGSDGIRLEERWKQHRQPLQYFSDPNHPYSRQGGADVNKYKLFLELNSSLLASGGRLGIIVPGGIYTDKENHPLRKMLITEHRWEWLFSFENRARIFQIDTSLRFCVLISQKGGKTSIVSTAFMRSDLRDLENDGQYRIPYSLEQIRLFSPANEAMLEVLDHDQLRILTTLYQPPNVRLSDENGDWETHYVREYDMSGDSAAFHSRTDMEYEGSRKEKRGIWSNNNEQSVAFYTGKMISQFDFAYQEWSIRPDEKPAWRELSWDRKDWMPQFIMPLRKCGHHWKGGIRLAFRDMAKAINERTMISAAIPAWPCGNKVPFLYEEGAVPVQKVLSLCAVLNSYVFDFVIRTRLTGINLNKFIVEDMPVPLPDQIPSSIALLAARLNLCHEVFALAWIDLSQEHAYLRTRPWRSWWAISNRERIRLRSLLDAAIADLYGLDAGITDTQQLLNGQFAWIVRMDRTRRKGFWRVGRKLVPKQAPDEVRPPQLALAAYCQLKKKGLSACIIDDTAGTWQLPDVAAEFYDDAPRQQAESDADASWRECERLAQLLRESWNAFEVKTVPTQPEAKKQSQRNLLDQLTDNDGGNVWPKS